MQVGIARLRPDQMFLAQQLPISVPGARVTMVRLRSWRLAMLDDAALKDLGLSRADVLQESERSFWDDPQGR